MEWVKISLLDDSGVDEVEDLEEYENIEEECEVYSLLWVINLSKLFILLSYSMLEVGCTTCKS